MEQKQTEVQSQAASTGAVENTSNNAAVDDAEVRYAKLQQELSDMRAERDREQRDKENYRAGMLAAKGKLPPEDLDLSDPTQLSSFISKTVDDRVNATREKQKEQEIQDLLQTALRENKELKLSMKNRSNSISSGASSGGTGQAPSVEVKTELQRYWSDEQIADFRRKGWSDEKIKKAALNATKMGLPGIA